MFLKSTMIFHVDVETCIDASSNHGEKGIGMQICRRKRITKHNINAHLVHEPSSTSSLSSRAPNYNRVGSVHCQP
ncbi:hypothetical protein MTR_8g027025 [Medicago truncatula]|uniref:Uncharacterized protein n=1 Tax=Medicago truncatula TaxID=3880 RepID=A0A072TP26_MEDTR|nr:hypothetical protein MTR_8g027025 [Medicago truncatula]